MKLALGEQNKSVMKNEWVTLIKDLDKRSRESEVEKDLRLINLVCGSGRGAERGGGGNRRRERGAQIDR
jgi:hypothetical protein